jgi:hypothetical protein
MVTATCEHFLAGCQRCDHVFSLTTLPVPLSQIGGIISRAECPSCGAPAAKLRVATESDEQSWLRQQRVAAAGALFAAEVLGDEPGLLTEADAQTWVRQQRPGERDGG